MKVGLASTCLADGLWRASTAATRRVLEHVGCQVVVDNTQTCCGQPAFNAGDWDSARRVGEAYAASLAHVDVWVVPSASCAAMVNHGYTMLWPERDNPHVLELTELLWEHLGVREWPSVSKPVRVALHVACHARGTATWDGARRLIGLVGGVTLDDIAEPEQCCGFGGSFTISHQMVSSGIAQAKLKGIPDGVDRVVSTDIGCLLHLEGTASRSRPNLRFQHVSELLAEAL